MLFGKCSFKSQCRYDHPPKSEGSPAGAQATFQAAPRGAQAAGGGPASRTSPQSGGAQAAGGGGEQVAQYVGSHDGIQQSDVQKLKERLKLAKELHEQGLIDETVYQEEQREILASSRR